VWFWRLGLRRQWYWLVLCKTWKKGKKNDKKKRNLYHVHPLFPAVVRGTSALIRSERGTRRRWKDGTDRAGRVESVDTTGSARHRFARKLVPRAPNASEVYVGGGKIVAEKGEVVGGGGGGGGGRGGWGGGSGGVGGGGGVVGGGGGGVGVWGGFLCWVGLWGGWWVGWLWVFFVVLCWGVVVGVGFGLVFFFLFFCFVVLRVGSNGGFCFLGFGVLGVFGVRGGVGGGSVLAVRFETLFFGVLFEVGRVWFWVCIVFFFLVCWDLGGGGGVGVWGLGVFFFPPFIFYVVFGGVVWGGWVLFWRCFWVVAGFFFGVVG